MQKGSIIFYLVIKKTLPILNTTQIILINTVHLLHLLGQLICVLHQQKSVNQVTGDRTRKCMNDLNKNYGAEIIEME